MLNPSGTIGAAAASTTQLTFDGSGLVMPKGTTKTLSLKCDLKTGVTARYWWGIDAGTDITSISGITSGQTIAETIIDSAGQRMSAAANGSYTVRNEGSLVYRIVRAGTTDVVLGRLVFEAGAEEDVKIQRIAFALGSTTLNSASDFIGEKATVWDGNTKVGDIQFSTGGLSQDNATSTLSTPVLVLKGNEKTLTIKADLSAHSVDYLSHPRKVGVTTANINEPGQFLQIDYDGDNNGLNGNYAYGVGSGATISGTAGDVAVTGVRVFANYPSITDATAVTALQTGTLYSVKVTAVGDDISIGRMSFDVLAGFTDVTPREFKIVDSDGNIANATAVATTTKSDNPMRNGGSGSPVGGAGRRLTIDFDNTSFARYIQAGSAKTYHLQIQTLPNFSTTNTENMTIRLIADTAYATSSAMDGPIYPRVDCFSRIAGTVTVPRCGTIGTATSSPTNDTGDTEGYAASGTSRFIWSPNSTSSPTEDFVVKKGRRDWTNSYGIPGFPGLGLDMNARTFSD